MSSTDQPQPPPLHVAPELLAELAQAQLAARNAAQYVEILTLRIAVRYGLPQGATWDAAGVVTLPVGAGPSGALDPAAEVAREGPKAGDPVPSDGPRVGSPGGALLTHGGPPRMIQP